MTDTFRQIGLVLEELPNLEYRVQLSNGQVIRAYLAGKLKLAKIKVIINDKVEVVFNPSLGGNIGRIMWRL